MDTNKSQDLDTEEFLAAVNNLKLEVTEVDLRRLFNAFDTNRNGKVCFTEFINAMRGELPQARFRVIQ